MIDRRTMMTAALTAIAGIGSTPKLRGAGRHEPDDRLRVLVSGAGRRRYQARRICRPADPGRQHRLALWLHAAICRACRNCGREFQRPRPDDHRRSLQRFRRPGTGRRDRDRRDRAAPIWRYLSDRGQSRREGPECAPVLQMGGRGPAEGCSALELPQIPDRPRRLYRGSLPGIGRAGGYARENRHRAGAGGSCRSASRINRSGRQIRLHMRTVQPLPWQPGPTRVLCVGAGSGPDDGKSRHRGRDQF